MWTIDPTALPSGKMIALAIGVSGHNQRHIGIMYRPTGSAPPRFLHLARHMDLRDDDATPQHFRGVVVVDLPDALQPTIVAQCKRSAIADVLGGLPYGFGYDPGKVERNQASGRLELRGFSGLTCATFVLAVFGLARVHLAELATWKDRADDEAWKDNVVAQLRNCCTDAEIEAVIRDKAHVRMRPEDTAGCATIAPLPSTFQQAAPRACEILLELQKGKARAVPG